MRYEAFQRLWLDALEYPEEQFDRYVADRGWQEWMDEFSPGDDADRVISVLTAVYRMAHGGCRAIRDLTGLSQVAFAAAYNIPRRSVECWESRDMSGRRTPPDYVLPMLGYCVMNDQMGASNADAE